MPYRLDGYIVDGPDMKRWYEYFGYASVYPAELEAWLASGDTDMTLYINSPGGDVFAGSLMYSAIQRHGGVTVIIDGLAASAASFIALGGQAVKMTLTAEYMIHNVSMYAEGDYRDMSHASDELKAANRAIINAYRAKTGLSEPELQALMDEEHWFDAFEARKYGFVDEIIGAENVTAPDEKVVSIMQARAKRMYAMMRPPKITAGMVLPEQPTGTDGMNSIPYKKEPRDSGLFSLQEMQLQANKNILGGLKNE